MQNHLVSLAAAARKLILLLGVFACVPVAAEAPVKTIYTEKGKIYSAAGEQIVLRGFNEMFVWSQDKTGARWIPEMAQTGANSVRLVWDKDYPKTADLIALIERSIAHKMIAIPECHNATGKWGKDLDACVNFWNNPQLINAIQNNSRWTILNIANEAGDHAISNEEFVRYYTQAIHSLRAWGYTVPIMIDASSWGQNLAQLLATGPQLQQQDPLNNIIFSVHSYWSAADAIANYEKVARAAEQQGIAMIVGEGPSVTRVGQCDDPQPLPYLEGMKILQEHQVGWLNWSWGGMKNGDCDDFRYFDITREGRFGDWQHQPGANIVAHSAYSVMQTSTRPASFYPNKSISVSGVYIYADKQTVSVGDSTQLHILIAPSNASNQQYSLRLTGAKNAISLDRTNNRITALAPGKIDIEAVTHDGNLRWSTSIDVR